MFVFRDLFFHQKDVTRILRNMYYPVIYDRGPNSVIVYCFTNYVFCFVIGCTLPLLTINVQHLKADDDMFFTVGTSFPFCICIILAVVLFIFYPHFPI